MRIGQEVIVDFLEEEACQRYIHALRWKGRLLECPHGQSHDIAPWGRYHRKPGLRRYRCQAEDRTFHDLTGTLLDAAAFPTAVWMLVAYVFNNLFQALANWIMADISQRALKQLRTDLFGRLQELPLSFFDRHPAGELMSRLTNDIDAINQAVSQNAISLVASVLSMVGIIAAMFALDAWLALASVIVLPIMFWFTDFVARYTRRGFRDLQRELGAINSVMDEMVMPQTIGRAVEGAAAPIVGPLLDRFGPRVVMPIGAIILTLAMLGRKPSRIQSAGASPPEVPAAALKVWDSEITGGASAADWLRMLRSLIA
jgi:hypothetical protein